MIEFPNSFSQQPYLRKKNHDVNKLTLLVKDKLQPPLNNKPLKRTQSELYLTLPLKIPKGCIYYGAKAEDGSPHGVGLLIRPKGNSYFGRFILGKRSGQGTTCRTTGTLNYKGEWKEDKPWGFGAAYSKDKKIIFKGLFEDGVGKMKRK